MKWIEQLDSNVMVCDAEGIIIYMNEAAIRNNAKDGGADLIGRNLMDCHNEESRRKLDEMMTIHQRNVYTIEKNGRKKLIYQTPWMDGEEFKGIVEISLEIPFEVPHFKRD
jgi:transcriptional regulator with PAS, ATPase and Fis domain